jgi:hypothetical protein
MNHNRTVVGFWWVVFSRTKACVSAITSSITWLRRQPTRTTWILDVSLFLAHDDDDDDDDDDLGTYMIIVLLTVLDEKNMLSMCLCGCHHPCRDKIINQNKTYVIILH